MRSRSCPPRSSDGERLALERTLKRKRSKAQELNGKLKPETLEEGAAGRVQPLAAADAAAHAHRVGFVPPPMVEVAGNGGSFSRPHGGSAFETEQHI